MTNEQLAVLGAAGDTTALHRLYYSVAPLLFKLTSRYFPLCAGRISAPEDLIQCGYFALLGAVKAYKPEKRTLFNSYLGYHVTNMCLAELGIRGKRCLTTISFETPVPGQEDITIGEQITDPHADIYSFSELNEMQIIVRSEIEKLPAAEKAVIYGSFYDEMPLRQIAEKMGWPVVKAKKLKSHAYSLLRKALSIKKLRRAWCFSSPDMCESPEYLISHDMVGGLSFITTRKVDL